MHRTVFEYDVDLIDLWLGGKNVRKNQKGISVIATGDGLLWADHSLQQNILAYYRVRSPFAQLLVSMTKDR